MFGGGVCVWRGIVRFGPTLMFANLVQLISGRPPVPEAARAAFAALSQDFPRFSGPLTDLGILYAQGRQRAQALGHRQPAIVHHRKRGPVDAGSLAQAPRDEHQCGCGLAKVEVEVRGREERRSAARREAHRLIERPARLLDRCQSFVPVNAPKWV